jgi:hypothetical protein
MAHRHSRKAGLRSCQLFPPGTPVSSTNPTDHYDINKYRILRVFLIFVVNISTYNEEVKIIDCNRFFCCKNFLELYCCYITDVNLTTYKTYNEEVEIVDIILISIQHPM